ncbi:MAG: DivIVA domain-containing protein [Bdellovibrionales bacterium]|nr:DivIVA domain-containing protein [Bdellovibrionales bacterium]
MKIVPIDVAHKSFKKKMMGYDIDEVTEFLHAVADEMEKLIKERNDLKEQLRDKEIRILEYKERDKVLNSTIETAQKMSEKIREETGRESKLILNDAQQKADLITKDARDSLKSVYGEITNLKKTKVQIEANLRALLQAHMQLLDEQMRTVNNFIPATSAPSQSAGGESVGQKNPSISPLST